MKAMILAAGRGERMRPLTDVTPKPLLKAGGKPLIVWHIERLARAGFTELVVNHAHLGEKIEAVLGNGSRFGVSIRYSHEIEALETAGGIANAMPLLGPEPFLVVNGDIFCDYDFTALPRELGELSAWLVLVDNPDHHPDGDFALRNGKVLNGGEHKLTFSGIGIYRPELFAAIARGTKASLAPLLREQMTAGRVGGEHHCGLWLDVGTPQRLRELDQMLQNTSM
ncbi:MAG: mannose-1-phosphate guanylyltransferase [Hydrogenophilales bacterium CG_4_9_14_3_um_filter_59_35]|nr:MAG: mannose-1-phosphate guanylyltransferase [Hydrogenophilales bacterium CG18_big_fil_WC_8_21_14_2_50_58_12]PIY01706.1 MAG: mannose-1-phosphate guanylyltransferase [Hydrogenophilales bacterium CG_4_10_14_3_um_filter_58_23]PJB08490.1 MAG: mannose-1-phosphate guanylyltransferase [Hydrogenophilales bacterium CG_4_9_14_3_um_filter_59_35]